MILTNNCRNWDCIPILSSPAPASSMSTRSLLWPDLEGLSELSGTHWTTFVSPRHFMCGICTYHCPIKPFAQTRPRRGPFGPNCYTVGCFGPVRRTEGQNRSSSPQLSGSHGGKCTTQCQSAIEAVEPGKAVESFGPPSIPQPVKGSHLLSDLLFQLPPSSCTWAGPIHIT